MRKLLLVAAASCVLVGPALADEVGVRVGPAGPGATVGESHPVVRDRESKTVIKKDEPGDSKTVIKKEDSEGNRSKTVIHHDD